MPSSSSFGVFIILKDTNYVGNELVNTQIEYSATSSPACFFFITLFIILFLFDKVRAVIRFGSAG